MTGQALQLPGIPVALADELRIDSMDAHWSAVNVREALATYARATGDYRAARMLGDIVPAHDEADRAAGVRWRAATTDGGRVMVAWQRARAELVAAVRNRRDAINPRGRRS